MRRWMRGALAALLATATASGALAQADFPNRSIRLLVGFPPGGSTDVLARTLAQEARGALGQEILIINKPGATGSLSVAEVIAASADGHTIGITPSSTMTLAFQFQNIRADLLESTQALLVVGRQRVGIAVERSSPHQSLKDLIAAARVDPGKMSIGIPGAGTMVDVLTRALVQHDKVEVNIVPFQGDAPIVTALLGRHIVAGSLSAGGFAAQIREGTMRLLVSMEAERIDVAPDVPTLLELGYPYRGSAIQYMYAPKGLPPVVYKRLTDAFLAASRTASFIDIATKNSLYDKETLLGGELEQHLLKDRAELGALIERLGLRKR